MASLSLTIQWPEYDWCDMSVNFLPTISLEDDIRAAFYAQVGCSMRIIIMYWLLSTLGSCPHSVWTSRCAMVHHGYIMCIMSVSFFVQAENNDGVSPPDGIVVFRRGKLPMRVGMTLEDFTQVRGHEAMLWPLCLWAPVHPPRPQNTFSDLQVVVYQAAAQVSLARVGYGFDDN